MIIFIHQHIVVDRKTKIHITYNIHIGLQLLGYGTSKTHITLTIQNILTG